MSIKADFIWLDGQLVKFEDAKVHFLTHSLHYANAVFEGTRAYLGENGMAIFRLQDHTQRLLESAKITAITPSFSKEELENAQIQLLRANNFKNNVYIRPLIFIGDGIMGIYHIKAPVRVGIAAWEWGAYLGEDGLNNGIKVCCSSLIRNSAKANFNKAKASANYLNSMMAKYEAINSGYEEALMIDEEGFIAEGTGECFFMVKNGVLISPPNDYTLKSITQDTVLKLAKDLGIEVRRQRISRDEVYVCDEAFLVGTAAEITPINSLDNRIIADGLRGKITKKLQDAFFDVVYGKNAKYASMLTYI